MKYLNKDYIKQTFHLNRLIYIVIFALLFSLLGTTIPNTYYRYFDKTDYVSVRQPARVDKMLYQPCDTAITQVVRTSLIDVHGDIISYVVLVDGNNLSIRKLYEGRVGIENSKDEIFIFKFKLPCDLSDGSYYIQAVIQYRFKSVEKAYSWKTFVFQVKARPTQLLLP